MRRDGGAGAPRGTPLRRDPFYDVLSAATTGAFLFDRRDFAEDGAPMRSMRLLAVALLGALTLTGCDYFTLNEPSATPVAPGIATPTPTYEAPSTYAWDSACELLAGVDSAALVDEPVGDPYVSKPSRCQMEASAERSTGALDLYITSPGGASDFEYQKKLKGVGSEFSGLGDAAFQSGGYLHVLVGDNEFSLVVIRHPLSHDAVAPDDQVAAARIILANTGW